jgi:myo-inositol 2-dehydrogenase / D-chiro-inositol 1-dehydrogenase
MLTFARFRDRQVREESVMAAVSRGRPPGCRVGFVGTGGVATRHAQVLSDFDDVSLVAATDVDDRRATEFADRFDMAAVDGVDGLLRVGVDAVYVCVPPFAHGAAELQVARAGVALFVEKPLAADLETAEAIGAQLTRAGVLTRVGHHWRCAESVARARVLLAGRRVHLVTGAWWDKVPPVSWWPHRSRSGGPVVEQAIHLLDLARVLVGEVDEVHAGATGPHPDQTTSGDVDTATVALLRFAGGAVGTLTAASVLGWKHRAGLEIVADGLVVGVGEDWLEVYDGAGEPHRSTFDRWTACVAADRAFVDALSGRSVDPDRSPPDHAEALRSHRLATAVARSAAMGTPERV